MVQALVFAIGAVTRIFLFADHFTARCGRRDHLPLAAVADVRGWRFYLVSAASAGVVLSDRSDRSDLSDTAVPEKSVCKHPFAAVSVCEHSFAQTHKRSTHGFCPHTLIASGSPKSVIKNYHTRSTEGRSPARGKHWSVRGAVQPRRKALH